ncbi:MAG TPA: tetratricopeptide repeat protein [Steroidobacteraceae bacterium]|nr:tetratricopeptide repeat protein [Steroidobacteraceae bacterium]
MTGGNRSSPEAETGSARVWLFGAVRLDERSLQLTVRGQDVPLHRKPLLVLLHLLQHPGEVVTKDELAEACWPRRVLSDTVLTTTLNRLRQALGDEDQSLIKTVHGFGYRLAAPVRVEELGQAIPPRLALQAGEHPPLRPTWSLVERLGGGGSGEIWRARHDKTGDQRVYKFAVNADGLKAIKREITLYRLLRETVGERADLVRIFDWNLEHSPFFLESEYVLGGDVRQWSQAQGGLAEVTLATRLDIVAQCAEILAIAHGVGVLHKDLKPANVLVADPGPVPRIKLTDFGSGALLDSARLASLGITRLGYTTTIGAFDSSSGTPLYLPPEVLAGQPATVQADVYALGIMLYQAVVGDWQRPLASGWEREVPDPLLREDIAAAVDGDPKRRLADAADLARGLRRLEERRTQRAAEEAERRRAKDLQERLARTELRRRWTVTTIAVLTLGLIATLFLYWQLRNSERGRELALAQARNEAAAASQINDYLTSLFDAASPQIAAGRPIAPRALVDAGQNQVANRFADQPLQRARLLGTIGSLYCKLGLPEECRKDLEQTLQLERSNGGVDPLVQAQQRFWLAQSYAGQSRWDDADKTLRQVIAALEGRVAPTASTLIAARRALGIALANEQKITQSIAELERTRTQLRAAGAGDSPDAADVDGALADSYADAGRTAEALQLNIARMMTERARVGSGGLRYLDALRNVAHVNALAGHLDQAEKAQLEVVTGYTRIYGEDAQAVLDAEGELADILNNENKIPEAIEWCRRVVAGFRGHSGVDNPDFAIALSNLAELLEQQGAYEQALPLLREAYGIIQRHFGNTNLQTFVVRGNLGRLLTFMHRDPEALEWLLPELPPFMEGNDATRARGRRLKLLADCYGDMHRNAAARQYYDQAETVFKTYLKPGDDIFATLDSGRAHLLGEEGRYQEALPLLRSAVEAYRRGDPPGVESTWTLALQMELAETLVALHRVPEATAIVTPRIETIRHLAPTQRAYQTFLRLRKPLGLTI